MPVTGLDLLFSRRTALLALVPVGLVADEREDRTAITEMFGSVAASLSEENPTAAVKWFDPAMPHFDQIRTALFALVEKYEVSSVISVLSIENNALILDWFLELKSRNSPAPVLRRRTNIKCSVGKKGKAWRILSMEPVEFFE